MKKFLVLALCLLASCQKEKPKPKTSLTLPEPTIISDPYILQDQGILERLDLPPEQVMAKLNEIQKPLEKFDLTFPSDAYNVITLPESSPYKIIKRLYLDKTPLGSPFFLEVRRYDNNTAQVQEWTLSLLTSPFQEIPNKRYPTFLGQGDRNQDLYDPSHGFSVTNRGIFVSFIEDKGTLYVIYADAPWETLKPHLETLLNVIPDEK